MRAIRRSLYPLLSLAFGLSPAVNAAMQPLSSHADFPNLASPIDPEKSRVEPTVQTVTQEQMTLPELRAFFDALDRGAAVRLVYRNGSEYAGNYSGGDSAKPQIFCRKGVSGVEPVPLEAVTDAYVFVTDSHLVRIRRLE